MTLASNLYKLYLIKISKWFMLTMPIIVLFYQENGLGMKEVLLLQGIYSVAIVAIEIPSGYFADVWGRKGTIIIGAFLGVIGFLIYSFSYGFWGFLIAELVLGVGQSFISGSDSALLYDSLLLEGKENSYTKIEGRILSIGNFAETIAAILGGLIAEISLRMPFIVQIFVALIAIPAAFTLVEPNTAIKQKNRWKTILSVLKTTLIKNKELQSLIIFTAFIGTATLTMAWFIQPYLKNILNLSFTEIGLSLSLLNLIVGLTTLFAYKVENYLGRTKILIFIIIGITTTYFLMSFYSYKMIFVAMAVFYFSRGLATPILKDYINRSTSSDIRATVLSIRNFSIRIVFAIAGPLWGWYSDKYSLQAALLIAGFVILISSIISLAFYLLAAKKSTNV